MANIRYSPTVRAYMGGWVDVTSNVRVTEPINISRGIQTESTKAQPSKADLVFDDPRGDFNPDNPMGQYYGLFGRNTLLDISVKLIDDDFVRPNAVPPAGVIGSSKSGHTWLAQSTPNRIQTGNPNGWMVFVPTAGEITRACIAEETFVDTEVDFTFYAPRANLPSTQGWVDIGAIARADNTGAARVKATIRAQDSAHKTAGFGYQFHVRNHSGIASGTVWSGVLSSTEKLMRARIRFEQQSVRFKLWYDGDPEPRDFTAVIHVDEGIYSANVFGSRSNTPGLVGLEVEASSDLLTDLSGMSPGQALVYFRTFTVSSPRFMGEISDYSTEPDDLRGNSRFTAVEASGILRRLASPDGQRRSPLAYALSQAPGIVGYWPGEDAKDAGTLASLVPQGLKPFYAPFGGIDLASEDDFYGSRPLSNADSGPIGGDVPDYPFELVTDNKLEISWVMRLDGYSRVESPDSKVYVLTALFDQNRSVGGASMFGLYGWFDKVDGGFYLQGMYSNGPGGVIGPAFTLSPFSALKVRVIVQMQALSLTVRWQYEAEENGFQGTGTYTFGPSQFSYGRLSVLAVGTNPGNANAGIGHFMVRTQHQPNSTTYAREFTGWMHEYALQRMVRMCAESGVPYADLAVPFEFKGYSGASWWTSPMGAQIADGTLLDNMQDAADTDGGILCEPRGNLGLHYTARNSMYNLEPVVTLTERQLRTALRPQSDDRYLLNDVQAKRAMGGELRYTRTEGKGNINRPPTGIGSYSGNIEPNCARRTITGSSWDSHGGVLLDHAGWAVAQGSITDPRYTGLEVAFESANVPAAVRRSLMDVQPGQRIDVVGAGSVDTTNGKTFGDVFGTQRMLVYGYTERISNHQWSIRLDTSPYTGWDVLRLDAGTAHHRIQPTACQVSSDLSATGTSVFVNSNEPWVTTATHPTAFPLDAMIGGELVSVTGITGSAPNWTWTVVRSQNGVRRSHKNGTKITLPRPFRLGL